MNSLSDLRSVQVLRGDGPCQHPGASDEALIAMSQVPAAYFWCPVQVPVPGRATRTYVCGWWYITTDDDGNVVLRDEPLGAGHDSHD